MRHLLQIMEDDAKNADFAKVIAGTTSLKQEKDTNAIVAGRALLKASQGEVLSPVEREALSEYAELLTTLLTIPNLRARLRDMQKMLKGQEEPKDDSKEDKE